MGDADERVEAATASLLSVSPSLGACLRALEPVGVWIGAGAIAQTVWNAVHGYPDGFGIRDLDVVYFAADASPLWEQSLLDDVRALPARCCPWRLDLKNQATVHRWYSQRFGHKIRPYTSLHDAIASWPTTATSVAVRASLRGLEWMAPFGLDDLHRLIIRANRVQAPRSVFDAKAARWRATWPQLTVLTWEEGIGEPAARWRPPAATPAVDPAPGATT